MSSTWRSITLELSSLLAAAVLLGGPAPSSLAQEQQAKAADVPAKASPAAKTADGKRHLNDPLLKRFGELLDKSDDLESSDKNTARKILEEADPLLTRIRMENRRAIERANQPARIHRARPRKIAPPAAKGDATTKKADSPTPAAQPTPAAKPTPAEKAK
jgi:hypothetical protein